MTYKKNQQRHITKKQGFNMTANFSNRESLMAANSAIILQLQQRLSLKRYRPNEADDSKLGHMNTLINSLKLQNEILKDFDLEDIKNEINRLKGIR